MPKSRRPLGKRRYRSVPSSPCPGSPRSRPRTPTVVADRGRISDATLERARAAGVTDAELAETVAHVALNTLSNYFNHLARPDLDFPAAPALDGAL
ncbi:MAG: carboxymuconolactone decarboxylase family protein [Catenulispora sp.]